MAPRKAAKAIVVAANDMLLINFRRHCQTRHPHMRYLTREEHKQDHRLHDKSHNIDHTHEDMIETPEEEVEDAATEG